MNILTNPLQTKLQEIKLQETHIQETETTTENPHVQSIKDGTQNESMTQNDGMHIHKKHWPHAPIHLLDGKGTYIVTASTLHKKHLFNTSDKLDKLHDHLLDFALEFGWELRAWAVFSNHYHFVGKCPANENNNNLKEFLSKLQNTTARNLNEMDHVIGRRVWFQFWDTNITFHKPYMARLKYVHLNAVKHGLVKEASQYKWCSAAWFEQNASPAMFKSVMGFKIDNLNIADEYF